jgi:DNA-binding transcriptional LysR family regulator
MIRDRSDLGLGGTKGGFALASSNNAASVFNSSARPPILSTAGFVVSLSHCVAGRTLTPADLVDEAIFTQPEMSTIGRTIRQWFDAGQCTPKSLSGCNSLSVTSELVAAGLGFAVMTPAVVRDDIAGRIRRFEAIPPIPPRTLSVAALDETWSGDIEFIAKFVADAFRANDALMEKKTYASAPALEVTPPAPLGPTR